MSNPLFFSTELEMSAVYNSAENKQLADVKHFLGGAIQSSLQLCGKKRNETKRTKVELLSVVELLSAVDL